MLKGKFRFTVSLSAHNLLKFGILIFLAFTLGCATKGIDPNDDSESANITEDDALQKIVNTEITKNKEKDGY